MYVYVYIYIWLIWERQNVSAAKDLLEQPDQGNELDREHPLVHSGAHDILLSLQDTCLSLDPLGYMIHTRRKSSKMDSFVWRTVHRCRNTYDLGLPQHHILLNSVNFDKFYSFKRAYFVYSQDYMIHFVIELTGRY